MTPARLDLDYVAPPRRRRAPGLMLLALAVAGTAVVLERYRDVSREAAGLAAALALLPPAQRARARQGLEDELMQAESVARQLSLPWAAMIRAVEAAGSADVALLQMEPDAGERRLRLMAEATSEQAMLEYLRRLARAGALTEVHLAGHRTAQESALRPVQFTLLARLR